MTQGLSESDDWETGRLVKWLAIFYQLAVRHKINRALGILNEPAFLDEIARVQHQPKCVALEDIPEKLLVLKLQPMQDSAGSPMQAQSPRFQDKRNTQRGSISSLTCHITSHVLVFSPTPLSLFDHFFNSPPWPLTSAF